MNIPEEVFSLPNNQNESSNNGSAVLSGVEQTNVFDHQDLINCWSKTGLIDQHLRDEICRNVFNLTNCAEKIANHVQEDQFTISNGSSDGLEPNLLTTNSSSFVPSFNHTHHFDLSSEKCFLGIKNADHIDNSWLANEAATAVFNLDANLSALLEIEQSYADLYNERKVTKSAASVATCELKDVLSNQMVLSAISPTRQNSLRRNVTAALGNKDVDKWYCVFCFNNARFAFEKCGITIQPKVNGLWRTHVCKDSKGVVICPVLAAHVCRHCGATGKFAHTEKYCESRRKRRNQRTTNSNLFG